MDCIICHFYFYILTSLSPTPKKEKKIGCQTALNIHFSQQTCANKDQKILRKKLSIRSKEDRNEKLLKQTIDLSLTVNCFGRLEFWKSLQVSADQSYSGENFLIFLQFYYSLIKIYIILIEITMNASSFQSNKTYMLNFMQLLRFHTDS